ncbi:MAG: OmpA family protein [Pseudomonadota bacterium]
MRNFIVCHNSQKSLGATVIFTLVLMFFTLLSPSAKACSPGRATSNILFDEGQFQLLPERGANTRALVQQWALATTTWEYHIFLEGYASESEAFSEAEKWALSHRRLISVRMWLMSMGVSEDSIHVRGHGSPLREAPGRIVQTEFVILGGCAAQNRLQGH